jgi:hypothetical protein
VLAGDSPPAHSSYGVYSTGGSLSVISESASICKRSANAGAASKIAPSEASATRAGRGPSMGAAHARCLCVWLVIVLGFLQRPPHAAHAADARVAVASICGQRR